MSLAEAGVSQLQLDQDRAVAARADRERSLLQEGIIQDGPSADTSGVFGEYVYALVLVCISAFVALYHLVLKEPLPLVNKIATPLLALGWVAAAGVLTFREPSAIGLAVAGNGFFAVYIGLFLSFALVVKVHFSPARNHPADDDATSAA